MCARTRLTYSVHLLTQEETPSISLMEDMACGQGYPKAEFGTFNGAGAPYNGKGYPKPGTTVT